MAHDISKGLTLIKEFEGFWTQTYDDYNDKILHKGDTPKGTPTISYGIIESDYKHSGIHVWDSKTKTPYSYSKEVCEKAFEKLIKAKYCPLVDKYDKKYEFNDNEYNAMLSFVYNIGSLNGLTADGTRSKATIAKKLMEYNKACGRVLVGLTRRRKAEQELFLKPMATKKKTYTKLEKPSKHFTKGYAQRGDKNSYIKDIQTYINWYFDKFCCYVDGKFGQDTENYTKKLQKELGVTVDGKFGNGTWNEAVYVKHKTATTKGKFIGELRYENKVVKKNPKKFKYGEPSQSSWSAIDKAIKEGKTVKMSCVTPTRFALRKLGISNSLYVKEGKFTNVNDNIKKHFTVYTEGHGVGYTVKQAVDKGLLKRGDIIGFKGITHTVCFYGGDTGNDKYRVWDGGTASYKENYKNGIVQYYNKGSYKDKKISTVARWK